MDINLFMKGDNKMSILSGIRKQKKYIKDENGDFKLASNWTSTDTVELSENVVNNETSLANATAWNNTYDAATTQPTGLTDLITKTTTAFENIKYLKNRTDSIDVHYFDNIDFNLNDYTTPGIYNFFIQDPSEHSFSNLPLKATGYINTLGASGTLEVLNISDVSILQIFKYDSQYGSFCSFTRNGDIFPDPISGNPMVLWGSWRSETFFTPGESYTVLGGTIMPGYITGDTMWCSVILPKRMDYVTISSNPENLMLGFAHNGSFAGQSCDWISYKSMANNLRLELTIPPEERIDGSVNPSVFLKPGFTITFG